MDLAKHIKPLAAESSWSMSKRNIRDLFDYHEGAFGANDGTMVKPEGAKAEQHIAHKGKSSLHRMANSHVISRITS